MYSYAYDPDNIGHKYINSEQLDEDLKSVSDFYKINNEKGEKEMNDQLMNLMKLKPQNLAKSQHDALKEYTVSVLQNMIDLIKEEKYEHILDTDNDLIRFSADGDGYGKENWYINMDYGNGTEDIGETISELKRLKEISEHGVVW